MVYQPIKKKERYFYEILWCILKDISKYKQPFKIVLKRLIKYLKRFMLDVKREYYKSYKNITSRQLFR